MTPALVAVAALEQFAPVRAAYVFGSQIEGTANKWSDIDVAAFVEGLESWDLPQRIRTAAYAQMKAGILVELHLFPARSLTQPMRGSFAEHILKTGVRLSLPHADAAVA